jgi:hypothetical protein
LISSIICIKPPDTELYGDPTHGGAYVIFEWSADKTQCLICTNEPSFWESPHIC